MSALITKTMVPSQMAPRQSIPYPKQFSPTDWAFDPVKDAQRYNWRPSNALQTSDNYFDLMEPYKAVKNSMFNTLNGEEPIFGHINFFLNPMEQEQTGAHTSAYFNQKLSRVYGNTDPFRLMRAPAITYPTTLPINVYKGSMARPPMGLSF